MKEKNGGASACAVIASGAFEYPFDMVGYQGGTRIRWYLRNSLTTKLVKEEPYSASALSAPPQT